MKHFSIKEAISFGWNTFKSRPWFFVQAGIVLFLVNLGVNAIQSIVEYGADEFALLNLVSAIVGIAVSMLISMGETAFFLRAHDGVHSARLADLWHPQGFWRFVGATFCAALIIVVGFILLIVPGVIAALALTFVSYVVIEEGLSPIEALKRSAALTKGSRWQLFVLGLALFGINILGLLALGVGLFVSIPVSFLAMVHVYRALKEKTSIVPVEEVVPATA